MIATAGTDFLEEILTPVEPEADAAPDRAERVRFLRLLLRRYSSSPKRLGEPGPTPEELQVMAAAALRAPDHGKLVPFRFVVASGEGLRRLADLSEVPAHDQWACIGGAISNAVSALHLMGYGAKMLSGVRVEDPEIVAAYCGPGEQLVGWISAGTPKAAAIPRGDIDPDSILRRF